MARRNTAEALRQQKDAKQKKLLILLVPLFLGLVAWQGPKMYKAFFGSQPEATASPAAPAPAPSAPAAPTAPAPAPATGVLADTDVPPSAGIDRLISFSRFESRDPFGHPDGGTVDSDSTASADEGSDAAPTSAVLDVNGVSETVSVNDDFPAGDPTFRLVSLSADGAVIGLVSGSFEGGQETVELAVGEQVELVADDAARYAITLVSVG